MLEAISIGACSAKELSLRSYADMRLLSPLEGNLERRICSDDSFYVEKRLRVSDREPSFYILSNNLKIILKIISLHT
jgi:hypothetical protein